MFALCIFFIFKRDKETTKNQEGKPKFAMDQLNMKSKNIFATSQAEVQRKVPVGIPGLQNKHRGDQADRLAKETGYLVVEAERISNKAKQDTTSAKELTSVSLRIEILVS